MQIRPGSVADAALITQHRVAMFTDMGHRDSEAMQDMAAAFQPWVAKKLEANEYLAWFAVDSDGSVVAGIGLWLMDWLPHMVGGGAAIRGNIVNVYTHPQHRRKGLARELLRVSLDWCRSNGIPCVVLHASAEGRALYEWLGFTPTNEMRLLL